SGQQVDTGASSTIFLIGTPAEEAPLDVVVTQNPVISTGAAAPGAPGVPGAVPASAAADQTWYRDSLNEIEARLAAIEERLRNITGVEGAQEDAEAALDEVAEA